MEYRPGLHFLRLYLCFLLISPRLAFSNEIEEESVLRLNRDVFSEPFDATRVSILSWHPRAFLYKGFLSDAECDHLIAMARDSLEKSTVADDESGKSVVSEVRTSSGTFLKKAQDEVVAAVEQRIATWTFLPIENGEGTQILRYEPGQKYEPHYDYFSDEVHMHFGGHRIATVLMYLSNVTKGGETVFPEAKGKDSQPKPDDLSDCAKEGYAVKPEKGNALLFFNLRADATPDPTSLHGSCPVIEGEKWSATKWIHVKSFEKAMRRSRMPCLDRDENCEKLAKEGRCEKNPLYMVDSEESLGNCRKSCKVCTPRKRKDVM